MTKIVGIIFMGLSFAVTVMPAAMVETFSIDGMALNTNNNFPRKDGHPIMSTWRLNPSDNDQQFDRQGQLLRHRSTGKCLNAYQPSMGSKVNVYPCNSNDGDQKFDLLSVGNNMNLIRRTGTNLCLDMPNRNANIQMQLWECNVQQTIFQGDGNLVIYSPNSNPVWASNTDRRGGNKLVIQDDANVVMYTPQGQPVWATNTSGIPCRVAPQPPQPPAQRASQRNINNFVNQWNIIP